MKKYLISITVLLFGINCYPQLIKTELANKIQITYKDILELRLQILAMQMTSGTYRIINMSRIDYPVSIKINYPNKIVFEIEKEFKNNLSKEAQKNIIEEGFNFVKTGITELIRTNYPELNIDYTKDISGYWYYKEPDSPCAKWENDTFFWINQ
jgi:hypothetical protein